MRIVRSIAGGLAVLALGAAGACMTGQDWRTASRKPVGLAPDPHLVKDAVVQVYGARAVGPKGWLGIHTWVATKPAGAQRWTVYELIGWRLRWSDSAVVIHERAPDGRWFGAEPELYVDKRGAGVDALIERIDRAARAYPYASEYRVWPGPNSNTFTAWIARAVPELELDLPATAIGKDYLGNAIVGSAPSGSGFQFSLAGLFGFAASGADGVEINLLGLNFGVSRHGLKLPVFGILGPARVPSLAPEAHEVENLPAEDLLPAIEVRDDRSVVVPGQAP